MTGNSRRKNYKNIVVFSYFTKRKTALLSSVVLESIAAVLLHGIEIDFDEALLREDLLYSSSLQPRCNIFSKSFRH